MTLERWRPRWGLRSWEPLRELEDMERRVADLFRRPSFPMLWRQLPAEMGWTPAIDVFEKEDKYIVKAELPGIKQEDIDISVVGDTLTIRGERQTESEIKDEDYHCCERSYGSFFRSIPLPSVVDANKITASYDEGVLEVTLPKTAEVKAKKIAIATKEITKAEKPKSAKPRKKKSKSSTK